MKRKNLATPTIDRYFFLSPQSKNPIPKIASLFSKEINSPTAFQWPAAASKPQETRIKSGRNWSKTGSTTQRQAAKYSASPIASPLHGMFTVKPRPSFLPV
uniref:Uncharacterized protein n=1 Tax=Romanomermis culicivorax TaxID=13658 RepID=A0A915KT42_ROMCU